MTEHYAYPHIVVKAKPHRNLAYIAVMPRRAPLSEVVARNAKAIRGQLKLTQPQVAAAAKARGYEIDQGTISRIELRRMSPSIEVLEALAAGLDASPWQLLVPDLDPRNPPVLREATASERALWQRLSEAAKQLGIAQ